MTDRSTVEDAHVRRGSRWYRDSVRVRITLIATAAVAIVLAGGAYALVSVQRNQLLEDLDRSLVQRADDLTAVILADGTLPERLPITNAEIAAVQLVAGDGSILAATENATDVSLLDPASMPPLRPGRDRIQSQDDLAIDDDDFRVLTRSVVTSAGDARLVVAASVDEVRESTDALASTLRIAIPAIVLVLAALVWWLVGRTLRPVEAIRAEVATIGAGALDRRVPVPATDDEIGRLARTMNAMLDRIEEATRRQQRFVSDAAHELRSPLTRMRTELEVGLADSRHHDPIATERSVLEDVAALQHLVDDLLTLARADAGAATVFGAVDLDDVVLREARRRRDDDSVAIDTTRVSAACVQGNEAALARVVGNLLDNALRHASTRVEISLREEGDVAELVVADDGPGIAPADAERIFERFARTDAARTRDDGGTGLGLAIVREIVRAHRGSVRVAPPSGAAGARFEVVIPSVADSPISVSSGS